MSSVDDPAMRNAAAPANFFDQQRVILGASALLIRDDQAQILLVKPQYRQVWHLPGGFMEQHESPRQAAERETNEETGLQMIVGRLLVVDYKSPSDERPACLQFVFDGGVLSEDQIASIVLQVNEIEAWRAASSSEALALVQAGGPAARLAQALVALDSGIPAYLEDGQAV